MNRDAIHAALDALLDAIVPALEADEAIAINEAGAAMLGVELAALLSMASDGTLRTVRVGRKRLTTRRWFLAALEELPAFEKRAAAVQADEDDDLREAAARAAARAGKRKTR